MGIKPLCQHFKAFIIPIILYQFQKNPFCLIILYDILFYFIHVPQGKRRQPLGDNFFDGNRKVLSLLHIMILNKKWYFL